jgi:hypothetical protein
VCCGGEEIQQRVSDSLRASLAGRIAESNRREPVPEMTTVLLLLLLLLPVVAGAAMLIDSFPPRAISESFS